MNVLEKKFLSQIEKDLIDLKILETPPQNFKKTRSKPQMQASFNTSRIFLTPQKGFFPFFLSSFFFLLLDFLIKNEN